MNRRWPRRRSLYSTPVPKQVEKPKMKWRVLPILWMALKRTCTVIGAGILILCIIMLWTFSSVIEEVKIEPLPDQMVLYMQLDGNLGDLPRDVSFADPFSHTPKTMKVFIDAIERAKTDPRVEGIYARLNGGGYVLAHIQELRAAIKDFQESGKFTYIYAPSYGGGLGAYYLASVFDEIWIQPMGSVVIAGLNAEMPFLRNALDRIGIKPEFFQRKEYKNAYESLTNTEMSEANRESMKSIVGDIADILSTDISADMGIAPEAFKSLVDKGLFLSHEAVEVGLVNKVDYVDKLVAQINQRVTGDPETDDLSYIDFDAYISEVTQRKNAVASGFIKDKKKNKSRVALVYASGMIMDTDGKSASPLSVFDDGVAAADEIAAALLEAAEDETIKAVVLRVDSPGGSPVASETILRAVQKVQEKGKTVTVSMGPTAASGGYWISAAADQIFVLPTTITGSVGVLGGKISAEKLWENLGINWERIDWGENAGMWSMNTPFSESESERMNAMLDHIYDSFIERVAKGRDMSVEDVDKVARGRVWVGTSAIEVGLADQFGGLNDALDYAAVQAGVEDRSDVDVVILPKPLSPIEQFIELLEGQALAGKVMASYAAVLKQFEPLITEFMVMQAPQKHSVYAPLSVK